MNPKRISDSQEALSLIERYKKSSGLSNCFLMAAEIERLVKENRLMCAFDEANAFLLEDKGNCYRIHYMISNDKNSFCPHTDKPLMLEILFRGKYDEHDPAVSYWERQGFRKNLVRKNLVAKHSDLQNVQDCTCSVIKAEKVEDGEFARSLFNSAFDPYSGDYITSTEAEELIKNGQILIAKINDESVGAIHFYNVGKCAWIGHVAVCSNARGRGIGQSLVSEYIRLNYTDEKSRYALWVQEQNKAAVAMYNRFGFKYAGKSSLSMIKESI